MLELQFLDRECTEAKVELVRVAGRRNVDGKRWGREAGTNWQDP